MAAGTKAPEKAPIASVQMTLDKETKGTYRFRATDENAPVTIVYVAKDAFDSTPSQVTLTLS